MCCWIWWRSNIYSANWISIDEEFSQWNWYWWWRSRLFSFQIEKKRKETSFCTNVCGWCDYWRFPRKSFSHRCLQSSRRFSSRVRSSLCKKSGILWVITYHFQTFYFDNFVLFFSFSALEFSFRVVLLSMEFFIPEFFSLLWLDIVGWWVMIHKIHFSDEFRKNRSMEFDWFWKVPFQWSIEMVYWRFRIKFSNP